MRTRNVALSIGLASLLLLVIYWPGLQGSFFFDDGPSILQVENIQLKTLNIESLRQAYQGGSAGPTGRPIAQLTFALNYYFSNFNPFAFKATNLAIHFTNGLLVFWLLFHLLTTTSQKVEPRNALMAASSFAALWLLHPIQLLPVLHVVQRMTSLSALFLLGAFLLHIYGREKGGRLGAIKLILAWGVLWPLSIFSKETGLLFPLFVLAWELILRKNTDGGLDRFARSFATLAGIMMIAGTFYTFSPAMHWLWTGFDLRPFSLWERLLTESRVLWFYLGLILFPRFESFGLYHDDINISTGLFSPWTTIPSLLGVAGLCWLVWKSRNRAPLVSFGVAWFLIGHAMESSVLPLEIAHEHRNYLPLFGILLALSWPLLRALENTGVRKTIGFVLTFAALSYFSFVTSLRSLEFSEIGQQTQIEAQHHRNSARAQFDAGSYLAGLPDAASPNSPIYAFARKNFELAGKLDPNEKQSWLGLILLNCQSKQPLERAWVDTLSHRLNATPFAPADRNTLYAMKEMSIAGTLCLSRSDMEKFFSAAFSNPTVSPYVRAILYSWYADYLVLHEKDPVAGRAALAKSLELVPSNVSNRLKWAQLIFLEGRREEAKKLLIALPKAHLAESEKQTVFRLLLCVDGDKNQCGSP